MTLLRIEQLSCARSGREILKELSLDIPRGQVVGLLGENGSGKTTLLKCMGNALPYTGSITFFDGNEPLRTAALSPRELAKRISYIPQVSGITIDITCLEVVLMGLNPVLGLFERPGAAMIRRAEELLFRLGLGDRLHSNYQKLSQGQKQLCLLARTLLSQAPLLLLDEPESALDFGHRYELIRRVRDYIGSRRSALITLHDPQLALNYCDRIQILHHGRCGAAFAPAASSEAEMEEILSEIYGPLCIRSCYNKNQKKSFVVLAAD